MNLKNAIAIALAGAAVAASGSAFALTPTVVNGLAAGNIIYLSGSTATDAAIQAWAKLNPAVDTNAPFTAGSYDLYKTATGYVLTGTAGSIFGGIAGTNIAIVKQTQGGSAIGIHNVAQGLTAAGFSDILNATFPGSCGAAVNTPASNPFQAFNTYTCSQAEISVVPNAGISDEDPTSWIGTGPVTAADASALTATNGVQVPFGIIVSLQLRNALQTAEGLTANSETLVNVPSLTLSQVRAMLSGQFASTNDLWVFNPTTGNVNQVDTSGSFIHTCRRGDTSGSQFSANIYFFGKGCSKGNGVSNVSLPDDSGSQANGVTWVAAPGKDADGFVDLDELVFAGSGTGDVRACVDAPTDNPANGDTNGVDTFNFRIGFVSMDQVPQTGANDASGNPTGWRYVALQGIAPTIWNIQLDKYDYLMEDTFNSTTASLAANGGGNHSAIFTTMKGNFANVNALAGLNAATRNAAASADASGGGADTGLVTLGSNATPTPGFLPSAGNGWPAAIRAIATANKGPYSFVSKTYGATVNNCNAPYQINPVTL